MNIVKMSNRNHDYIHRLEETDDQRKDKTPTSRLMTVLESSKSFSGLIVE